MKINNGGANSVLHICCSKPWFHEFPISIILTNPIHVMEQTGHVLIVSNICENMELEIRETIR